jgi:lipopolysaccharide transport system ATP-binding protein
MSRTVVRVEGLSKAYRIGRLDRPNSLSAALTGLLHSPWHRLRGSSERRDAAEETFWALRDVSFEVKQGEVFGIIGRNGAGKSTLLRILSRITAPTSGEAYLHGRVSSLLDVGTGFHPELTGRENIFLNGAILGMSRAEINARFDQIVEFAEVARFLDTPVKRYSSGMAVRLAFAVAAHLEPEIMLMDEVLAVGDAAFQQKCLGKMGDAVKEGRTVLFVSHSMDSIAALCSSVMVMQDGHSSGQLPTGEGIASYLGMTGDSAEVPLASRRRTQHKQRPPVFTGLSIRANGGDSWVVPCGGKVTFQIEMRDFNDPGQLTCAIAIYNEKSQRIALLHTQYHAGVTFGAGSYKKLSCIVPSLPLTPGTYYVELVYADGYQVLERVERAGRFEVIFSDYLGTGKLPSYAQCQLVLPCAWQECTPCERSSASVSTSERRS